MQQRRKVCIKFSSSFHVSCTARCQSKNLADDLSIIMKNMKREEIGFGIKRLSNNFYSWRERNISIIPYLSVTDTFYKHHKNVIILSETSKRRIRDEMREDIKIQTSHKYILHRHHHSRAAHRVTQTKEIIKFTLLCGLDMEHTVNKFHLTPYTHINPSHPIYLFKCLI